jgi:heavy metal sensor kinase
MLKERVSISLRLTLWFGCVFFAGWVLFGVSMWANLSHTLRGERHQTLDRRLDRLEQLLVQDQLATPSQRDQDFTDFAHATGNGLVEILHPDGTLAYPSPTSAATSFHWPKFQAEDPKLFLPVISDRQSYWVLARPFNLMGSDPLVLMAAAPEAGNLLVIQSFLWGLLACAPLLLLISSAGGYWVSRRALKPVDRITTTARSISIRNISERIPVSQTGDELQRLSETCNAMLDRLELSVNQIKRFTADASHELRGPLSFTRTVAEIALKNPHADPESRLALQDIVDETAKATILLEEMLTLARADSLPVGTPQTPVNLATLLAEVCAMAQPITQQHGMRLFVPGGPSDVMVSGDASGLKRLIWILIDNAIKYSRPNGTISISLETSVRKATITVHDNGIGISPSDLPFVFDRFYRADPSRGIVEGNGLGLAIAKWIADTHQAGLYATSDSSYGTSFTIEFPNAWRMQAQGGVKARPAEELQGTMVALSEWRAVD